ncbi:MAG: hypothetical protein LBH43_10800 [Treponema sp.]|jgi:hypothetical protein|nr:hypothetical protein [Treponema sp.]
MKYKLLGENTPNMPWQEKPSDLRLPLWRYENNPIITCYVVALAFTDMDTVIDYIKQNS